MEIIFKIVGLIVMVVLLGLIMSYPIMLLWNYCLVPAIPSINQIEWFQAWGIMFLCSLLFKSDITVNQK
jgi:hypothetical protein